MIPRNIIIHHSATKDSETVSWQAIRRFHVDECAWGEIGYHFGVEQVQDKAWAMPTYEILFGRFPYQMGAHTKGYNHNSIGICCVGNFDEIAPPKEQWDLCVKLVKWLMEIYQIPKDRVFPHRQFSDKTCPGKLWDMDKFRDEL